MAKKFEEFATRSEADAFYDLKELEGFDSISLTGFEGSWRVNYGMLHEESFEEFMQKVGQSYAESDRLKEEAKEQEFQAKGRMLAGEEAAKSLGLEGSEAWFFAAGFAGVSAKVANPRKEGLEDVFRQGRQAYSTREGQKAARAAAVRIRSQA